jgi:hypothetical protein
LKIYIFYQLSNPNNDLHLDFFGVSIFTDIFHSLPQSMQEQILSLVRSSVVKDNILDSHEGHFILMMFSLSCILIMVSLPYQRISENLGFLFLRIVTKDYMR